MTLKEKINGNAKWLRYGSLAIALVVFVLAQGVSNGTKSEGIKHNKEDIVEINIDIREMRKNYVEQTAQISGLQANSKAIKEDVEDIKKDNKEILKILYQIKDK